MSRPLYPRPLDAQLLPLSAAATRAGANWQFLVVAALLVSVPVFFQAPLVRLFPWLSLLMTGGWLWVSLTLRSRPTTHQWGDLLLGFTWTWLAGSIYWGWLRWEPFLHLPIEAIALPFAIAALKQGRGRIGNWFYLGSLFGTVMTDLYFYLVKLVPYWRQVMQVEFDAVSPILQQAAKQVCTPWGIGWALVLVAVLLIVGGFPLSQRQPHWWTFGGAVLSTLLVDGLFWLAATSA